MSDNSAVASSLWGVDLDEVLQVSRVAGDWAAAVGFDVNVDAAVTEDEAGGGQHGSVDAAPPAQGTAARVGVGLRGRRGSAVLPQVERWRRNRQRGQGFHGALVLRGVPPI